MDKQILISMLKSGNLNEFDAGHNSAIIHILKMQYNHSDVVHDKYYKLLRKGINNDQLFLSLNGSDITNVINAYNAGNKLQAVKYLYEISGLGLKGSKDIIDTFNTLN